MVEIRKLPSAVRLSRALVVELTRLTGPGLALQDLVEEVLWAYIKQQTGKDRPLTEE